MAIPAFLFVEHFAPLLPVGLGFAAGAMAYVAVFELMLESLEDTKSCGVSGAVGCFSCLFMMICQNAVKGAI